jgi:hypothetical protein
MCSVQGFRNLKDEVCATQHSIPFASSEFQCGLEDDVYDVPTDFPSSESYLESGISEGAATCKVSDDPLICKIYKEVYGSERPSFCQGEDGIVKMPKVEAIQNLHTLAVGASGEDATSDEILSQMRAINKYMDEAFMKSVMEDLKDLEHASHDLFEADYIDTSSGDRYSFQDAGNIDQDDTSEADDDMDTSRGVPRSFANGN